MLGAQEAYEGVPADPAAEALLNEAGSITDKDKIKTIADKIKSIATKVYGAADISADSKVRASPTSQPARSATNQARCSRLSGSRSYV